MNTSIKIDSVFLNFDEVQVLRGVSFEFRPNKVTGILGRNGCGKSCLLKIITGQLNPASKHIRYNEKQLHNLYKVKGLINYLPQHQCHPTSIRLTTLLDYYAIEKIAFFKRYDFLSKNKSLIFSELSGGEKRIIEVLLVLEAQTKFTILDEPFSHIMPIHLDLVKSRITELTQRKGILITDHQYKNVMEISDHLFIMNQGTLKAIKDEEDLRFNQYIR